MTLDANFDLCVIGSGPAGIITVMEYIKSNPKNTVLLIEFGFPGQPKKNSLDDSIDVKKTEHHHDPYDTTNKGLGGTSLTWGGRCVMYDEIDFLKRPSINENCTWDLDFFENVKPFVPKATHYFECGDPIFDLKNMPQFKDTHIADGFKEGIVTDSVIERWSMPTRFGKRYGKTLEQLPNLKILLGYEARDFGNPDDEGTVNVLKIRSVQDRSHEKVKARNFVIASGGQESTRILLRNPHLFNKLGYVPDALGKFYQCHIFGKIASIIFNGDPKKTNYDFLRNTDGSYIRRRMQFKTDFLQKNDLLNTAFWLDNPLYFVPAHKNGSMSFMYLAMITPILSKRLAPPAITESITKGKKTDVGKHVWNLLKDLPGSLGTPATIFYKRYLLKRKLPGIFLYSPQNKYALHFHAEQIPVAENRLELSLDGEKLIVHYKITEKDIDSILELHKTLDRHLRDTGCGRLEYWNKNENLKGLKNQISKNGVHQIGTTRIADSPKDGVVDRNLKVYGTNNIYICSSSVFPTSGQANPTFFLGACAIRLAKHLD